MVLDQASSGSDDCCCCCCCCSPPKEILDRAETADPGEEDVIIDELPGGAREDRLVIAEETEPRVDVDPAFRIEVRVESIAPRQSTLLSSYRYRYSFSPHPTLTLQ